MNQTVRDLMNERADHLDAPDLDVAAILRDGSVRLRRRRARIGGALGALAACAVAATTVVPGLLPLGPDGSRTDFSFAGAFADRDPAYAVGSSIHLDGREFSVPTPVHAMVQTTAGIVYSDTDGAVWSATGDAPSVRVGSTDSRRPHLAADDTRAAWVDTSGSDAGAGAEYVVLDQGSGETVRVPASVDPSAVTQALALDGDDLYAYDGRGVVRIDLPTQEATVVSAWRDELDVVDVEQGQIAHTVVSDEEGASPVGFVSPTIGEGGAVDAWTMLDLSDDGAYLLGETEPDTFAVFDVAAGTHELISSPAHEFLIGYRWLDADTYLALGMNRPWDSTPVDLLRCELDGGCTVVSPLVGSFDDGMVLPVGEPMDG